MENEQKDNQDYQTLNDTPPVEDNDNPPVGDSLSQDKADQEMTEGSNEHTSHNDNSKSNIDQNELERKDSDAREEHREEAIHENEEEDDDNESKETEKESEAEKQHSQNSNTEADTVTRTHGIEEDSNTGEENKPDTKIEIDETDDTKAGKNEKSNEDTARKSPRNKPTQNARWRIKKIQCKLTEGEEDKEKMRKSTYVEKQNAKLYGGDGKYLSKEQQIEIIYLSKNKPTVLYEVQPNKDYVPEGFPRKNAKGTMPNLEERFYYTSNAYGRSRQDYEKQKPKRKRSPKKSNKAGKDKLDSPRKTDTKIKEDRKQ